MTFQGEILGFEFTIFQRMLMLWLFVIGGIVLAIQASQWNEQQPIRWTRVTATSKRYWYMLYVSEIFLFITAAYPILLENMQGYAFGYEEKILNSLWIGLLGIETLMVLGVAVQSLLKRFQSAPKVKTT
ncbi:unnamed protein product [Parascedosporium putredinis]|uniref:Uncharacterized protein n=1 Tax=Parascedosporium putredinis TaxID=1442378 RepID=A0A9P1MA59_9PEZI|nr:unnamed protein product [Parascedosporium putredinis]CAI7992161.1 unnamed protein product [Parascedosporium putredinis]